MGVRRAIADWMRRHVVDIHHLPEVMTQNAWPEMRWDRRVESAETQPPWTTYIIETSELPPEEVARLVARWLRERLMADKTSPPSRAFNIK